VAKIVIFVYSLDEKDPVFSHQAEIVRQIAQSFVKCTVLTLQTSPSIANLPDNVKIVRVPWYSASKFRRFINFLVALIPEVLKEKPKCVFSFMTETQSAIAGLPLRLLSIPQILWFAHRSNSFRYRLAYCFSNLILTSTTGSVPKIKRKVKVVGQMIDSVQFKFKGEEIVEQIQEYKFVHIGRLDPSKGIETICKVFEDIKTNLPNAELSFYGKETDKFAGRLEALRTMLVGTSLQGQIKFEGNVARQEIPSILTSASLFIHCYEGSLDKALVEATMVGLPVITCNSEYHNEFGFWNTESLHLDDPTEILLSEFRSIENLESSALLDKLKSRREEAAKRHSLEHWSEVVLGLLHNPKVV
jgi:glycosyltransferase involved in cell wall biosynthesis